MNCFFFSVEQLQQAISCLNFASVSKEVLQNFSYGKDFYLHENGSAGETNFHKNDFAQRLVLTEAKGNSEMA